MSEYKSLKLSEEDENIIVLRYELQEETRTDGLSRQQRLIQWFGRLSLLALGAATFAPRALHLSAGFRPWVFVTFILWITAFIMGVFNP